MKHESRDVEVTVDHLRVVGACASCRFWHRNEQARTGTIGLPDWGECWLFGDDDTFDCSRPAVVNKPDCLAAPTPFAGADGAGFTTHETFGCVQWEPR